ncbi:Scr1 family TA system antitoxin-like transcriptional regulator [Nocardia sp. CA-290969]|uniref:Scr1 family TA system antitoxin-like transcriptional regulator n=1 Tax=Nocardia sp. CA-290969 TaxID=3239986 RepID=UPI003D8DE6A3
MVGSPAVMRNALRHLADLPENVTVQVLPFSAGFPLGVACGPFTVLDFDRATGEPPTVYVEGYRGNMYYDMDKAVTHYRDTFRKLQRVALPLADSKQMLRRVAREYEQ